MTIDSNAYSLADYALNSNSPIVRAISYSLIQNDFVVQDIPILTKKTLVANGVRFEGNLPSVNWAAVNSEGVTTKGTPTPYAEQLYLVRNYIDVDELYVEEENSIVDPRAAQVEAWLKALAYDFNDKFFNNDHITGASNAPVGLKYRINNGSTFGVRPENLINANGLDISQATLGSTPVNGNKLLEYLDQLLWSVDSPTGAGVTIYANEVWRRRFAFAVRGLGTSGGFATTQDQFGRTIDMYKGAVIRDPGYKADQTTRVIPNTEASDGTAGPSTYTSIYAVNYSTDHFYGWQFKDLNAAVEDLGKINNGVIYRTYISWAIGLMNASTRSIGRLYGLKIS
jgi:hypothetical protein